MTYLRRDAHAILFPVITSLSLDDHILRFFDGGGCSILFGESPAEYASGRMSPERIREETSDRWQCLISEARARADGLLASVDADISAVHRLHELTPPLPALATAQAMLAEVLEEVAYAVGQAAFRLGINLVLSPTADGVTGPNPWLTGRTLGSDVETVSRMVAPYVRGLQKAGVAANAQAFPWASHLDRTPWGGDSYSPGRLGCPGRHARAIQGWNRSRRKRRHDGTGCVRGDRSASRRVDITPVDDAIAPQARLRRPHHDLRHRPPIHSPQRGRRGYGGSGAMCRSGPRSSVASCGENHSVYRECGLRGRGDREVASRAPESCCRRRPQAWAPSA